MRTSVSPCRGTRLRWRALGGNALSFTPLLSRRLHSDGTATRALAPSSGEEREDTNTGVVNRAGLTHPPTTVRWNGDGRADTRMVTRTSGSQSVWECVCSTRGARAIKVLGAGHAACLSTWQPCQCPCPRHTIYRDKFRLLLNPPTQVPEIAKLQGARSAS